MSPSRLVSGPAAERIRPFSFDRPEPLPPAGPALAAIHMEQEVERRSRELADRTRDEARQAGFEEGAAAARAEMDSVIDALRQAVDQATQATADALDDLARSALVAGVAIAEAVVGKVVVDDPAALFDPVRRAIRELDGDDDLVLHLHPADHRALRQALNGDHSLSASEVSDLISSVRIIDDPAMMRSSCRVESATRVAIDGIEQRLDDIRRAVEES